MKHVKQVKFLPLVLLGAFLAAPGCGSKNKKPQLGEVERLPRLETIKPQLDVHLAVKKTYTATVEPFEKADLCAQVRGFVKELDEDVDIGRPVKGGKDAKPLITLDIPDLIAERDHKAALLEQARNLRDQADHTLAVAEQEIKEAQAQEKRYHADLEFRELQYARVYKLAQGDAVAKQLAEEAQLQRGAALAALKEAQEKILTKQARFQFAKIELKVADSRLKVARAELERALALVEFGTIRAPFDGIITKRWVDRGATIKDPGMPLLTVMRTDKVRVILDIPERDVPYIRAEGMSGKGVPGNPVVLQLPALQNLVPGLEFRRTVTLMASALDPHTRTMRTEVHFPNAAGYLKPQMTGTATVVLAERKAITIPSSSLVSVGNRVEVFYLANPTGEPPRGVVRSMEVQLGLDDGLRVEILNNRLTGNELIIRKGNGVVRAGEQAIAVPPKEMQ